MTPQTIGVDDHKIVPVTCKRNDALDDLDIFCRSFALLILFEGSARFEIDGKTFDAVAPAFVCFDEHESPKLITKKGLLCNSIYFAPTFLNVNMTFERVHGEHYGEIADLHDLFLLMPFTEQSEYVFPLFNECIDSVKRAFDGVEHDLMEQNDWYWSCRSRSYFMEMMFMLERSYGYIGKKDDLHAHDTVQNTHLQKAIIYIESHYQNSIALADIAASAAINHTTLTYLFKKELSVTPVEYLWRHRLRVAKKQLEFTNLPLKDISARCGFKTVQHFCRKFEQETGDTPTSFREERLKKRIDEFG